MSRPVGLPQPVNHSEGKGTTAQSRHKAVAGCGFSFGFRPEVVM